MLVDFQLAIEREDIRGMTLEVQADVTLARRGATEDPSHSITIQRIIYVGHPPVELTEAEKTRMYEAAAKEAERQEDIARDRHCDDREGK